MGKKEYSDFKNCAMTTDEILSDIPFKGEKREDFLKYLYSLLFSTDINIKDTRDLQKIVSAYFGYKQGSFVTMTM